ncbi:hypothetical protein BO86DRAFT_77854 [Aspergillus japonicus CBS 114.51]|uniref:Uncharacterized protein n=1 Tax=Aspergillus japonicus CBS 114.51 TaxID=1448312 RepID=A0A8T8XGP7_ASPJA|nr:hypothetical protein BO86DRAFT_77854 [Aspergillus japonicus CBS 114.51]RAH87098.1 hypothetical protein BO86DRAFT_77854 [Aspergillus japonicus CBS 114.51]
MHFPLRQSSTRFVPVLSPFFCCSCAGVTQPTAQKTPSPLLYHHAYHCESEPAYPLSRSGRWSSHHHHHHHHRRQTNKDEEARGGRSDATGRRFRVLPLSIIKLLCTYYYR